MLDHRHRNLAFAGLAFLVLALTGVLLTPSEPEFVAEASQWGAFYENDSGMILAASALFLTASPALLWFTVSLAHVVRRAQGRDGSLAGLVLAGGASAAALMLAASAMHAVAALRVEERGAIDPQHAAILADLSNAFFGIASPGALAVLVLATAVAALRHALLPRWFGAVSVVLGVALLAVPVSYIGAIVFTFWPAAAALALVLQPRGAPGKAPVPAVG